MAKKPALTGIETAIKSAGGSTQDLADAMGVNRVTVRVWRRQGYAPPGPSHKMAELFAIPYKSLVRESEAQRASRPKKGIERAVESAGSQAALAGELGVTQQAVGVWVRQGFAPLDRACEIENLHGVSRQELVDPKLLAKLDTEVRL